LGAQKTISSYSFDRIVLIFGYIVERTNTKILSSHFFAISSLNLNYDVINDVISGFAKVDVERCGFHHWIDQTISRGRWSPFFSICYSTPGHEPRSVAASTVFYSYKTYTVMQVRPTTVVLNILPACMYIYTISQIPLCNRVN